MRKFFAIISAALLLAACADKDAPAPKARVFTATMEDAGSRTIIAGGPEIYWVKTSEYVDKISVFDHNRTNLKYILKSGGNTTSAVFATEDIPSLENSLDHVYAIYPYYGDEEGNAVLEDGSLRAFCDYYQDFKADGLFWQMTPMAAVSDNSTLHFKNLAGYLDLRLYGDSSTPVYYITITDNDNKYISGDLIVTFDDKGVPQVRVDDTSEFADKGILLSFPNPETMPVYLPSSPDKALSCWIAIPPIMMEHGFTVFVRGADGRWFQKVSSKPLNIQRGVCTPTDPLKVEFPVVAPEDTEVTTIYEETFDKNFASSNAWTFYDADGDGNIWEYYEDDVLSHSHSGVLQSLSWKPKNVLTPDNWAFTPSISFTQNSFLSFWIAGYDEKYNQEHYAVYITDKNPKENTVTAADCICLCENTFPAGNYVCAADDDGNEYLSYDANTFHYQRYMITIPDAFKGKTGYIAFRHFNCTDMNKIYLDDVCVTDGNPVADGKVSYLPARRRR